MSDKPALTDNLVLNENQLMEALASIPPEIFKEMGPTLFGFKQHLETICGNKYITKKELTFRNKAKLTENQLNLGWFLIKFTRAYSCSLLPYKPLSITYVETSAISRELHMCDKDLTKLLSTTDKKLKDTQEYISEAFADEAIFSSKLEGAVTTEIVAKEMIRKNIPPRTKDEMMILNNHEAMQYILDKKDIYLTPEFICDIQRIVTKGTLDTEEHSGMFRTTDDVFVTKPGSHDVLHYPPKAQEVPSLIQGLCTFVNLDKRQTADDDGDYIHPLIVGIALHFLIGYIHPFYDGNGRTARTLFYWYVISRGYDLFRYIPISKVIKKAPAKYRDAYLATEEDGLDLTYFLLYNIECIKKARKALTEHLEREMDWSTAVFRMSKELSDVTPRQIRILSYMAEHSEELFGINEIAERFSIAYQTARTDLMDLEARKYLWMKKRGKAFFYSIDEDLVKKIDAVQRG
ncbi:MAG: Fic family protein [Massilibacteroides sp.]|nr:Fic family protein [Massilibacteroides sp.]